MSNKIHEKAIIVRLTISQFNSKKTDQKITGEVLAAHQANADAGKFVKCLIPDSYVAPIRNLAQAARQYHYQNTLPWENEGGRIIPIGHYPAYKAKMDEYKAQFAEYVSDFVGQYETAVEVARTTLKDMFNSEDYPEVGNLRNKFDFGVTCYPIPHSSDFRVQLSDEDKQVLQQSVNDSCDETVRLGIQDVFNRVKESLTAIVGRLSDPEAIFRDSLFGNLKTLTEMIPVFNISDCPQLAQLSADLTPLANTNPVDVREVKSYRLGLVDAARRILVNVNQYEQVLFVRDAEEV